ncbi:MAG: hypothetical protein LBB77_04035, partial [Treponema sp.]|nr:hypothetical protein [Treponema sp.]
MNFARIFSAVSPCQSHFGGMTGRSTNACIISTMPLPCLKSFPAGRTPPLKRYNPENRDSSGTLCKAASVSIME